MQQSVDPLHVGMLPRVPFLAHSEELLRLLLSYGPAKCPRVLEIGCGPRSPLLPMLRRRWPDADVHQIDARQDVVAAAAKFHPGGKVERMLAWDMASISDGSKQLVIAMSVFDQNADSMLPKIAAEMRRVLAPDGIVVYLHNEELNLPATAISLLAQSSNRTLILPSDHWRVPNDLEYCTGSREEIDHGLGKMSAEAAAPLGQYLLALYPQLYADPPTEFAEWKVTASFIRDYNFPVMSRIRQSVAFLRQLGVQLQDYRTSELLRSRIETGIFCEEHGFTVARAGIFEMRRNTPWRKYFENRPPATYFVRSTIRFGYSAVSAPPPAADFEQELNHSRALENDEVMFIAHQYGLVARKC